MATESFIRVNHASERSDLDLKKFSIFAAPTTDIYCSPLLPAKCVYTAPIVHQCLRRSSFSSARLSFSFHASIQFDQAGLLVTLPTKTNPNPVAENSTTAESHPAFIKAGIEVNDGKAWISVVARAPNSWCDWSLCPIPVEKKLPAIVATTIEVKRYKNALMIWMVEGEEKTLIRKVPWVWLDDGHGDVWVGAYAARPDPHGEAAGRALEVEVRDLVVERSE